MKIDINNSSVISDEKSSFLSDLFFLDLSEKLLFSNKPAKRPSITLFINTHFFFISAKIMPSAVFLRRHSIKKLIFSSFFF